jgi:hypothetical protein
VDQLRQSDSIPKVNRMLRINQPLQTAQSIAQLDLLHQADLLAIFARALK